jgi:hypothetical protein
MDTSDVRRLAFVTGLLLAAGSVAAAPPAGVGAPANTGHDSAGDDGTFGPALAIDVLSALRGGDGQVTVEVDNQGTVNGNTASQIVSGDNRIEGGAFANAAGLTTVIQNSGSNVLIQNGTAVNVRFGAGP